MISFLVFFGQLHTSFHKPYNVEKRFISVFYDEQVTSVKIIGLISSHCGQVTSGVNELKLALAFFWKFVHHTLSSQNCNSEVMPSSEFSGLMECLNCVNL